MKKIILFLCFIFMTCGCGKFDEKNLIKELDENVSSSKNYQITGILEIFRNEDKFEYDVISTYKKGDYFKVELVNKTNNHEQIILKDKESVYVLTPSLNKSFKFQSDWPYNNSQIYLLQPIISDLEKDDKLKFEETKNGYTIESKVNYSSERDFEKQKIYFDKNKDILKIEVLDGQNNVKMCLNVINIEYNLSLENDFFDIKKYQKTMTEEKDSSKKSDTNTASLEEIVYPMYVPTDTYLSAQDVVKTEDGERVILTFTGESQFILIQENSSIKNNDSYVYGDPYLILDTIGSITDSSVSWISNGVEYSVISDTMSVDELLTVAQSVSVEPVGK